MSKGLYHSIKSAAQKAGDSINNHDAWAIRLVFFAGVLTILHKSGLFTSGVSYAAVFAVCLGIAALLYEMNAITHALRAWWSGRAFAMTAWAFVWLVAFGYSINQWVGAASENEGNKSNMHQAALVGFKDSRKALATAQATVDRLEERLRISPVRTPEAAQAFIDNAKAHRFWKVTNECRETKGPQTRDFCSGYASAVADKAGATEAIALREELKLAKADLAKAKEAAGNVKAEVSEARNDLVILTKYAGMKEDDARTLNALGSIIAISIFLSLASALREMEILRKTSRRVPMFPLRRWWASLRRFVMGGDDPKTVVGAVKLHDCGRVIDVIGAAPA